MHLKDHPKWAHWGYRILHSILFCSLNRDWTLPQLQSSSWCTDYTGNVTQTVYGNVYGDMGIPSLRQSCAKLTHSELDTAILGQIAASANTSATVSTIKALHKEADRERRYSSFTHQGKQASMQQDVSLSSRHWGEAIQEPCVNLQGK